ncbi:restriction endonuclease subunit S [Limibacillus halophilus]|uniref:Type I restriction enzyme S subunit n=1 Tax=Limibacillus halophilus TaxID=1579333 RepID=A0A839SYI8_9PROT|nr:restriction endonuclease subunit S [Limibacillus halophilus]MBB3066003.1 type I restriction enzyme S subunit [Limibacillus halophilus]
MLSVAECVEAIIDYRGKTPPKSPIGIPTLTAANVKNGRIDKSSISFVSHETYEAWTTRGLPAPNDVLITTEAPVGEVAPFPGDQTYLITRRLIALRAKRNQVDPAFLLYTLLNPETKERLLSGARGSTVPRVLKTDITGLQISVPDIGVQRSIASLLRAIDDKIELNRRMNETLEAMARAIFKDWFVDFGPTRAKAEGRPPYLAPEIWDLFPDAVDEEGMPVGSRQGTLADVADSPRRGVSPADVAEDTPYIGLEHMPRRSIALSEWEGAGKVTSNKSVFKKGEFLFGKLRPYFHKVGFAPLSGICSTDIVVVVPRAPEWGAYTLACLSSDEFVDYTDQTSTGTKMPRTSWKTMGQYKVCLPSAQITRAFQNLVQPLLDRMRANIHEARTLAQTRDLLLPKLMSGEIRLRDAEKAVT